MNGNALQCRMRVHRQAILVLVCALVLVIAMPGLLSGATQRFYYADGESIALTPANFIGVRFVAGAEVDLAQRHEGLRAGPRRELPIQRLVLYPVAEGLSEEARNRLQAALLASPEVELVAPVFRGQSALLIVTDQFIAQFQPALSDEQIEAINREAGVESVKQVDWSPRTFILRSAGRDCLDTANRYEEHPGVVYAHPDFVELHDPDPVDRNLEGRQVWLGDQLLPPDTPIEKGSNRFLVIEPGRLIAPFDVSSEPVSEPEAPVTRVTIQSEGFEGAFPGDWQLYGEPTWDDVFYRPYSGSWSGYCVGSSVAPPGPYPANTNAWMVWGPFTLVGALDARIDFQLWLDSESDYDFIYSLVSVDGGDFYGTGYSGSPGDWMNLSVDLKRVPGLGNLLGQPQVWVAFFFQSDDSFQFEGAYIDEVIVEKITGGYESLTNDQFDHLQWSLENNEQLWGIEDADIDVVDAWAISPGSAAITIAVIDEGVDLTHPDLAPKMLPGYDASGGGSGGGPTGDDAHGTGCAGIAAGITNNGIGVAGVAQEPMILPVRVMVGGTGQTSWFADGINWATAQGADVLSNSWGGGSPATAITDAIANAKTNGRGGLGAVVVFASGNDNVGTVSYPASLSTTLAVGALSPCDERKAWTSCDGEFWWGSNYGTELDIMAPGVHMYTTDINGTAGYDPTAYYYNFNGTSSATPVVSGVAALILSVNPGLTATEVETILTGSADDLGTPGWDQYTGWGRVNAYQALLATPPPASLDLVANEIYFRDQPGGLGTVVTNPTPGQLLYPHFNFTINAAAPLTGTIARIELDAATLCTLSGTLNPASWYMWCNTPWTAAAGNHTLGGRVDPNDEFTETNESNNYVSESYNVSSGGSIFSDGFESGDTAAWSATVP